MPQNPLEVTNPDLVDVADQGYDSSPSPDQPVTTGPSQSSGPLVAAASAKPGVGADAPDQPVTTGPSQNGGRLVEGGTFSPQSPDTANVVANNVADQVYGTGTPANVFV
jgi:hypothetical protein